MREGRGADDPMTASVVVKARYTDRQREGELVLNASVSGKSEELNKD